MVENKASDQFTLFVKNGAEEKYVLVTRTYFANKGVHYGPVWELYN